MAQKQDQLSRPRPIRDIHAPAATAPAKKRRLKPWKQKLPKNPRLRLVMLVAAVLLAGLFAYNYIQTRNELGRDETTKLTSQIDKFLELPQGETPTLATVKDASKLKSQPFFKHAQDGDKVLIYSQAGRAVLYRPATKKVIEYSPISLGGSETAPNN